MLSLCHSMSQLTRNDPTSPHMVGDLGFDPLGHGIPVDPSPQSAIVRHSVGAGCSAEVWS